jgi:prepilin signal peptidase PulO-like enzyme (type II secretory pathway)
MTNARPRRDDLDPTVVGDMVLRASPILPLLLAFYSVTAILSLPFAGPERVAFAAALLPALIWLTLSDLRRFEIPDGAVLQVAVFGAAFQWWHLPAGGLPLGEVALAFTLTAAIWIGGGVYFRRTGQEAIGIGDAKLIGAGCLAVGSASVAAMVFVAATGGIVAGLLARSGSTGSGHSGVPFGPFLAYSVFVFVLFPIPGLVQP